MKLFLYLSSLAIFCFYSVATFPFEVPDEQSHFATVNFLINENRMPTMKDPKNLSLEEQSVERIFGIMTNENLYSYHPEYRTSYSSSLTGPQEENIKELNTPENRSTYTIHQSALYPPLYYYISSIFFRFVNHGDILMRLFITRFTSVILTSLLPIVAYLIGSIIWKNKEYSRTLAYLSLLFPMTAYLGVGINSDNLHNLLFGIAIYFALLVIKDGLTIKNSLLIGTVIGLDLITKPQAYILIPIFGLAILLNWKPQKWLSWFRYIPLIVFPILVIAGWQELPKFIHGNDAEGATAYLARTVNYGGWINFQTFLRGYIHTHLAEMPVWYWGVFKWFGVILPKIIWWPAIRLFGLAILGTMIHLYRDLKQKKLDLISRVILFSYGSNIIYIAAIFFFDWQFYQEYGRSLGLQARYYMPLLVTQMFLFVQGLTELGWNKKIKEWIRLGIIFFFLIMQLVGLYTQLSSYYDLLPLSTLWQQISQYKPFFAKGYWWFLWTPLYFAGIISLTTWAIKEKDKK